MFIKLCDINFSGELWTALISRVKTPYTLVGRSLTWFDNDTSLERLVREISELNVVAVSGAVKYPSGLWDMGCSQSACRNFTLVYRSGYSHSFHECVFCNYTKGPFLVRTDLLKENPFDSNIHNEEIMFRDFFHSQTYSKKHRIALCPDSMFYIKNNTHPQRKDWLPLVNNWETEKVVLENNVVHKFDCKDYPVHKHSHTGLGKSPCKLKTLANMVNLVFKLCKQRNLFCEAQEGTLLSVVKLGKPFPWERDADITFHTQNYSALLEMAPLFAEQGFTLKSSSEPRCCVDGIKAGGTFTLSG